MRLAGLPAGRDLLVARRNGYRDTQVVVHFASFALVDIWHSLTQNGWDQDHYAAEFEVVLCDPDEESAVIPLKIETLDAAGRVIDHRTDVRFRCQERWPERYRSTRRIPVGFFDTRPLRAVKGGFVRITFRHLSATYHIPFGPPPRERPKGR